MSLAVSLHVGGSVERTEIAVTGRDICFEAHLCRGSVDLASLTKRIVDVCVAFGKTTFSVVNVYNNDVLGVEDHRRLVIQLRVSLTGRQN